MEIAETGRNRRQELLPNGNQTDGGEIYRDFGLDRESEIFFYNSQTHYNILAKSIMYLYNTTFILGPV